MPSSDLSIIIVSFNTKAITRNCLHSIYASKTTVPYEVIVVDNHSQDDSYGMVKKEFPQVIAIRSDENEGFAKANNRGAKKATGKYILLLNSDTILELNTIELCMKEIHKEDAVVASCCLTNPDGTIQPQGGALPTLKNIALWMLNLDAIPFLSRWIPPYQDRRVASYTRNRLAGWLGGTALFVRRDVYASLNGLDEHLFMYGEDIDFCTRVHQGFLPIHYFAKPRVIHLGHASGSNEKAILGEYASLKYLYNKYRSPGAQLQLRGWLKVGALLRVIMYTLKGDSNRKGIYAKAFALA